MILPFSKALNDSRLLGQFFAGSSWDKWKEIWEEVEALKVSQVFVCKGRGSGGSRMLATKGIHSCILGGDWTRYLSPGETATALVLASDIDQAEETFSYGDGLVDAVPYFKQMVIRKTKRVIEFSNRTRFMVRVSNFRKVRGYTLCFVGLDELAFWQDASSGANPSKRVYDALLPALGRLPGSFFFACSTPWSGSGFFAQMIEKYKERTNPRIFSYTGDTLTFNPSYDRQLIDDAYADDPQAAAAEYGGQFRSDLVNYIAPEVVQSCTVIGRHELPPTGFRYFAFTDPSGGSSDSFTLAIAHNENGIVVLDLVREIRPPFSPEQATKEFCDVMKTYGITQVYGDRYAGEWPREAFRKNGIWYEVSTRDKASIYIEFLPLANSGRIQLLQNNKMIAQLLGLERSVRPGSKDRVDHVPGAHDDLINAAAGAVVFAANNKSMSTEEFSQTAKEVCHELSMMPQRTIFRYGDTEKFDLNIRSGMAMRNFEKIRFGKN